jgi:hypothetical protein
VSNSLSASSVQPAEGGADSDTTYKMRDASYSDYSDGTVATGRLPYASLSQAPTGPPWVSGREFDSAVW